MTSYLKYGKIGGLTRYGCKSPKFSTFGQSVGCGHATVSDVETVLSRCLATRVRLVLCGLFKRLPSGIIFYRPNWRNAMFFNRNSFCKVDRIRRIILDGDNQRVKSDDKKRLAPKPSALRLENLEERALLSVVPPFANAGIDQNAESAIESSYAAPRIAVPDLSGVSGLTDQATPSANDVPLATAGTYDEHDLAAIVELGLEATSPGVVWNGEGQLVELTYSDPTVPGISLTRCKALEKLTVSGCVNLTYLDCSCNALTSLDFSGCSKLEWLYCNLNELTELDLSGGANLICFDCSNNDLTELDLSKLSSLSTLYCYGNQLTSIDVSGRANLCYLDCRGNSLTSLNLTENKSLSTLLCNNNSLTSLNLLNNSNLSSLYFSSDTESILLTNSANVAVDMSESTEWNSLTVVDGDGTTIETLYNGGSHGHIFRVSSNYANPITISYYQDNILVGTTLIKDAIEYNENDLEAIQALELTATSPGVVWNDEGRLVELTCSKLTKAEISLTECETLEKLVIVDCANLTNIVCQSNDVLTDLVISGCQKLTEVNCNNNALTSLSVSDCTSLQTLDCSNNAFVTLEVSNIPTLTTLNVSGCENLTNLSCDKNGLTSLDVSGCENLQELACVFNALTSLDVSDCTNLEVLSCSNNALTALDVSNCEYLKGLYCHNNALITLNVIKCNVLQSLWCSNNELTSLEVSGCRNLNELFCSGNALTSLDLSDNCYLIDVECMNNELTLLDVSGCLNLETLTCYDSALSLLDLSNCSRLRSLWFSSDMESVLLAKSANSPFSISESTNWNSLTVIDGDNGSIETSYNSRFQIYSFNVSYNCAYPLTISYRQNSEFVGTTVISRKLVPPTLAFVSSTETTATVEVGEVYGATKYVLEYATDSNFIDCNTLTFNEAGEIALSDLTPATLYYMRVKAYYDAWETEWNVAYATTEGFDPLVVKTTEDSAILPGTLRYALAVANDGDVVTFDSSLQGETISLAGAELVVDKAITVDASNIWDAENDKPGITISGSGKTRVVSISADASLKGLTVANGKAIMGAGVFVESETNVSLIDCIVTGNILKSSPNYEFYGGGVYSLGDLTLQNVTISSNMANANVNSHNVAVRGVGVYAAGNLTILNSEISSNSGDVSVDDGTFDIRGWGICSEGELAMNGCFVHDNKGSNYYSASGYDENPCLSVGGGVYAAGSSVSIVESSVANNRAGFGGGLYLDSPAASLTNCTISENTASWNIHGSYESVVCGGGIYNANALTLEYVEMSDNTANAKASSSAAHAYGGALYSSGTVEIANSSFNGNTATASGQSDSNSFGGAVSAYNASVTISNSTFEDNESNADGGAIHVEGEEASITLEGGTVKNNSAGRYGAGVRLLSADGTMSNVQFVGNAAGHTGGALNTDGGSISITGCEFSSNVASNYHGGAAHFYLPVNVSVTDTTFTDNSAGKLGGAVKTDEGTFTITGCEFTKNVASDYGGAMYFYHPEEITLADTTFTRNTVLHNNGGAFDVNEGSFDFKNLSFVENGSNSVVYGGAINLYNADGTISNCSFEKNVSNYGGAINSCGTTAITITDTTFEQNVAKVNGGAIYAESSKSLTLVGGTFKSNSADNLGGAIRIKTTATTIDNVVFNNNAAGKEGGAIKTDGGSLSIDRSEFSDNVAGNFGGAVQIWESTTVVINNTSFTRNKTLYHDGGAIYLYGGSFSFENDAFTQNGADSVYVGGAVYVESSTGTIQSCSFVDNSAKWYGGACNFYKSSVDVDDVTVTGNTAEINGGGFGINGQSAENVRMSIVNSLFENNSAEETGGAISAGNGVELAIKNTSFENNVAHVNGGAVSFFQQATITLEGDVFKDNNAENFGGALYMQQDGNADVVNTVMSNNEACSGGGIYSLGNATFTNCTLVDNEATDYGGGIYVGATIELRNSIVVLNTATDGTDVYGDADTTINANAVLSSYETWTNASTIGVVNYVCDGLLPLFVDAENSDYRLAAYSQAIDKGNNDYVSTETDLKNLQRIVNSVVDLGAYEYQYNAHDLAAIEELGLTATSPGLVWNDEGRLVELIYSNSTIESISLSGCKALTKLDVSGCDHLTWLYCPDNALTSLDFSGCSNLTWLYCQLNALTSLDLSKCANLTLLNCGDNELTSLNLSELVNLTSLYCYGNQLTSLDLSKCANLTLLNCLANALGTIDLTENKALETFLCNSNALTSLNLLNNSNLGNLRLSTEVETVLLAEETNALIEIPTSTSWNKLTVVDGNADELETLYDNRLHVHTFDASSDCVYPITVSYYRNETLVGTTTIKSGGECYNAHDRAAIESLGLTTNSEGVVWNEEGRLVRLTYSNPTETLVSLTECAALEKLDVSGCVNLKTLNCYNNALTSLDFSGCANLQALTCYKNALTSLDLSKCTTLTYLYCAFNELSELDLSKCENLTNLLCGYNKLSSLDASCCANLWGLYCYANELTSLNVSGLAKLHDLSVSDNQLTSLDFSNCVALGDLQCDSNSLTTLDVSMCANLTTLFCNGNALISLDLLKQSGLRYLRFSSDTESVLLASDANVSIELSASTNWDSMKVVDVNDDAIETTYNNGMRVFNVSSGRAYPITIAYSQNDAPVGTTTINADPVAPTNLIVGEFSHKTRSITVSWTDNSTNETGFLVQYSTDEENWTDISVSADVTTATLSELAFDATYFVRVAATNDVGVSTFASGSLTTPLAMPESLRVVGFDEKNGLLVVSWGAAANQGNGYLVKESTDGGASWTRVVDARRSDERRRNLRDDPLRRTRRRVHDSRFGVIRDGRV